MIRSVLVLVGVSTFTTGCMSPSAVRSKIPFVYHDQSASDYSPPYQRNPHQQYYDKLHKRYYYYDQVLKAYYWENGQPKG